MKKILLLLNIILRCATSFSQQAEQERIQELYRQGVQYKDGLGVKMDYAKAYGYFAQAAGVGDMQSVYSMAYMKYKGLGCTQDYSGAASLFAKGAWQGRDNSMYFYGLCWRNGYGVEKREDSATYWLHRADSVGYPQARLELNMANAENGNDSAKALVTQVKNAAISTNNPINKFTKVNNTIPDANLLPGNYRGWLIQYDWSGQSVASAKPLLLFVTKDGDKLKGRWIEGIDSVNLSAKIERGALKFDGTKYKRTDHYSPVEPVAYDFDAATLNTVQQGDSLFLAGQISMFSPERKEPSKPLFVALSRPVLKDENLATLLFVGPNPFSDLINVNFKLAKNADVKVELLTIDGHIVYQNKAGELSAGTYQLPLRPGLIATGNYVVKFSYGNNYKTVTVIKQ